MKLEFGYGNIWVTSYGDKKGNYGVAFRIVPEKHIINASDPSVVGKTLDDVPHDLYMEFTKSQSVQVVINKLAMVRNDLRAAEQSVQSDELACDDIYHDFLLQWEEVNFCDVCGTPIRR